jgi:hypothetical protein
VRCRYLAVASKGWYGYGLNRSGRTTWHVTTVRSSHLLYIHDVSGTRNKLGTPGCNACRILLRRKARDEISDRNSISCQLLATLRRYGYTLVTAVPLQVCAHLNTIWISRKASLRVSMNKICPTAHKYCSLTKITHRITNVEVVTFYHRGSKNLHSTNVMFRCKPWKICVSRLINVQSAVMAVVFWEF